jgi:hypothetical protein
MKTQGGVGTASPFMTSTLDGSELLASCPGRFIPGGKPPERIGKEAEWAPELVWTLPGFEPRPSWPYPYGLKLSRLL